MNKSHKKKNMSFKVIRYFIMVSFVLNLGFAGAQETYRAEIGPSVGSSFYIGDANAKLFANQNISYGLQYRHKFNSRLAVTGDWTNTKVNGTAELANNIVVSFDNPVNAFDFSGEYNFLDLEDKSYKPFSRKYSTFIFAGVGAMVYEYEMQNQLKFSYLFGAGVKFLIGDQFNLNFRWSNRLLLTDQMEGVRPLNNAYGLNGSNLLNNDLLSTISIGLTINIFRKRCNCNTYW